MTRRIGRLLFILGALAYAACGPSTSDSSDDGGVDDLSQPVADAAYVDFGPGVPATHFVATAVKWPVSASNTAAGFFAVAHEGLTETWSTFDIDGDGRPDLVQTTDPTSSGPGVWTAGGFAHWQVYLNNGTGFATTSTKWPVPDSGLPDGFKTAAISDTVRAWSTFDIDGDGKPDLVQTTDPGTSSPPKVWSAGSAPYWKVYLNKGTGFATAAINWPVPSSGLSDGFATAAADNLARGWATIDVDGDHKPDLVQTTDPASSGPTVFGAASSPHWKVYLNTGSGFSPTATVWPVPPSGLSDGFLSVAANKPMRGWSTLDLNHDGKPDLVQTTDPASTTMSTVFGGTGAPHWQVYLNMGSGFSTTATTWSVPQSGLPDGFFQPASNNQTRVWASFDIDGDGKLDLVQTTDPSSPGLTVWSTITAPYWKVFRNTGTGFSSSAVDWSVPSSGLGDGFFDLSNSYLGRAWSTFDLNGDGRPDLVQTADPMMAQATVWGLGATAYWNVYFGSP